MEAAPLIGLNMTTEYSELGYKLYRDFFSPAEMQQLYKILSSFHESWQTSNADFYAKKAVNSAYITGPDHLSAQSRLELFQFIGSTKMMTVVADIIPLRPAFMNTQLFFNPCNTEQKNYWHRDPQYHLSLEQQQAALSGPDVVHFRIPLVDEPGLELVPSSHKQWDSQEELDVRLENNGRRNYENLSTGKSLPLSAGDLLVFSANMIHRGLYGMERLAFDIIFCESDPELTKHASASCLPSEYELARLEDGSAFANTLKAIND